MRHAANTKYTNAVCMYAVGRGVFQSVERRAANNGKCKRRRPELFYGTEVGNTWDQQHKFVASETGFGFSENALLVCVLFRNGEAYFQIEAQIKQMTLNVRIVLVWGVNVQMWCMLS